ncbi:hypothetical protein ACQ4PT_055652 [Festuca glaucescens]
MTNQRERRAKGLDLGVVLRGEKEFAVAELQISWSDAPSELHVFCPSRSSRWETKQLPLMPVGCADDFFSQRLLFYCNADKVVTLGSSLCWIDYCHGIIFCEVFDDSPVLYYKEFPAKVPNLYDNCHGTGWVDACQTVGVTQLRFNERVEGKYYSETWLVSIDLSSRAVKASHPYCNPELEETDITELEETDISRETDFSKSKYCYFESFLPTEFSKYLNLLGTR